jgi:SNF2 family DNA or RNA helicase
MEILENKAVTFRTRNPHKYSVIPKHHIAPINGGYEVTVFWGLDEMRVLKNLGIKHVPSPIERNYTWPGRYKPMAHQKVTAGFLTLHRRAFVFNDPGTAKTIASLWAADYLMQRGEVRRVLVVCPLSIMQSAWMGDIASSVVHRSAIIAHHTQASRRIEMIQGDYEIVIINYDGLNLVADEIVNDGRFDLIIVDEANAYATATTRRWKSLAKIIRPDTFLWMMTGTPAAQSPLHAYGLARLVNPTGVPNYFTAWRDKVMNKLTTFKWGPKPNAKDTVFEVLQPAIRYTKAQCLDLPPVLKQTREVEMTPQQWKYYKLIKEQMLAMVAGETVSAVNKAAVVSKLLQISCGAAYTENKDVVEFDATPRLNVLLEILQETSRKVIIFAMFRSSIDMISTFLAKNGVTSEEIHGGVTAVKRGDIINRFQHQSTPRVLVMQPQATAHGITLTAADTVVFFGPLMSVEQYTQCIARADRKGQEAEKVTVIHIQSSPIERKMFDAMELKVEDHAVLTQMFDAEIKDTGGKK